MDVYSVPAHARLQRVFAGPDAALLKVDPRTDILYVADAWGTIALFDPLSLVALERLELPGPAGRMVIDELENALLVTVPERAAVAVIDLTRRHLVSVIEVGEEPFEVVVPGAR